MGWSQLPAVSHKVMLIIYVVDGPQILYQGRQSMGEGYMARIGTSC